MKNLFLFVCLFIYSTIFAASPTISSFTPLSASLGTTITINGTNFTGTTAVSFGGTPASSFTVVSTSQITAVVAAGSSGNVVVTNIDGSGQKSGFVYISTSGIITDFGGYWATTGTSPNPVMPDSSYNLLAFTYNGITYSTGANNSILTNHSVVFTPGNYKALPVAGFSGIASGGSTYLALASKVDGSASVANTPAVASFSVKNSLVDGKNGLDLGTGITNLPSSAILTFKIYNIDVASIDDDEPDILLTQIAQPVSGNDQFSFIDASGTVIGNTLTQDMTKLPLFGTYVLDLFTLSPSTPYNNATAYSAFATNTTREIRLTGLRLSDFGINSGNVGQVKALRITPSGNSDYAFIGYNANSINLPPNIVQNTTASNTTLCSGGTANLYVLAVATVGGTLSYTWEESTDNGGSWTTVTNGGNYTGATTDKLSVANAVNGNKYRAVVTESGNPASATSDEFTIVINTPAAPSSVSISGTASTCLNTSVQLKASVSGGSNLYYQWQSDSTGSYLNIADANLNTYIPPVNQTGIINYRTIVTSGSGCGSGVTSSPFAVTVSGIASTTPDQVCNSGTLNLSATATSGTISWFAADAGGSALFTGNTYTTPTLTSSTTYYVTASGCSGALRVPVVATVYPATAGGTISGGTTVSSSTNSTTLTLGSNTGTIIKWQSSTDDFNTDITDIADTTDQLMVTNLSTTTSYRTIVQSGTCTSAFSGTATIIANIAPLPIHIGSIEAIREGNSVKVQWEAYAEQNTIQYELERSTDGLNFIKIYTVAATGSGTAVTYKGIDNAPENGYNFYRVREVLLSGLSTYSPSVKVLFQNAKHDITVLPNPVINGKVTLRFNNMDKGMYEIRIINNNGQVVYSTRYQHPGGYNSKSIELPSYLSGGIYRIDISGTIADRQSYPLLLLRSQK